MPIDNNRPIFVEHIDSPSFIEKKAELTKELKAIVSESNELLEEGWQYAKGLVHGSFEMTEAISAEDLSRIDDASQALSEYISDIKGRLTNITQQIPGDSELMRLVPSELRNRLEILDDTATSATETLHLYSSLDESASASEAKIETPLNTSTLPEPTIVVPLKGSTESSLTSTESITLTESESDIDQSPEEFFSALCI